MCDTLVAVGQATADGTVILARNSDRQPNETYLLAHIPRAQHEPGARVQCTYIEIPQVPETYEVLLSKPFWIWGCEMGANECGVAIGNEAVFTKEPYVKGLGMDSAGLAERCPSGDQSPGPGDLGCGYHYDRLQEDPGTAGMAGDTAERDLAAPGRALGSHFHASTSVA